MERVRHEGDEWLDPVRAAPTGPVPLAIDVEDMEFQRNAGDLHQIEPVSAALSGPSPAEGDRATAGTLCALTRDAAKLHAGPFPQPNLRGFGQTYIFSRNCDIPSLTRHGRTADASFPVAADLARRLKSCSW